MQWCPGSAILALPSVLVTLECYCKLRDKFGSKNESIEPFIQILLFPYMLISPLKTQCYLKGRLIMNRLKIISCQCTSKVIRNCALNEGFPFLFILNAFQLSWGSILVTQPDIPFSNQSELNWLISRYLNRLSSEWRMQDWNSQGYI